MKANELMIGDWVIVKGVPTKIHDIDEMDGINREWIAGCEDGGCTCYEDIQPIPLTSEILKKNGFVQDANYSFRFFSPKVYKTRDIGVDFTIKGFTFWYGDTISIVCGDGSIINRLPCFVRQLQHALKLCGIDKEIII